MSVTIISILLNVILLLVIILLVKMLVSKGQRVIAEDNKKVIEYEKFKEKLKKEEKKIEKDIEKAKNVDDLISFVDKLQNDSYSDKEIGTSEYKRGKNRPRKNSTDSK